MKLIFATTNERKLKDLLDIIEKNNYDMEVLTLNDIGWNLGEIEETGNTIQENSLIKARTVYDFCKNKNINYTILSDDAGLFVDYLNGQPGVYTARYASEEQRKDSSLPKYECVNKLLRNLDNVKDRRAEYRCSVTCIYSDGEIFQIDSKTAGSISYIIQEPIIKPYFYSVFIPEGYEKTFNNLVNEELYNTYRFEALKQVLFKINGYEVNKVKKIK